MSPRYRYVLLDADNTLFDFDEAERRALDGSLTARGVTPTQAIREKYLSINVPLWEAMHRGEIDQETLVVQRFQEFGAWLGLEADPAEWNREYLTRLGTCSVLLPGALDLLEALAPHCVLALATNGVARVQRDRLKDSPITPFFGERVFISGEMGLSKPDPRYFEKILDVLGAKRQETVMIGDTLGSDIKGAFDAGIHTVWFTRKGEESPMTTYKVGRLEDIPSIVLGGER